MTTRTQTRRRHIVVGDVHGELKGLTEILGHAGLIDDGRRWVGGDSVLIQTGDVIDRGPDSRGALALLRRLQKEAVATSGAVVRCCGNHELMLLQGDLTYINFKYPRALAAEFRDEIDRGVLQAAYTDGERLYTHAGLRSIVRTALVKEIRRAHPSKARSTIGVNSLADHINAVFRRAVKEGRQRGPDHCIFWVGPERGGADEVGGIFWCDFTSIAPSERAWDVAQVFGHSPSWKPAFLHARGLKLIDVDAGMCKVYGGHRVYLEIAADGSLFQHNKEGAHWRMQQLQ